MICNPNSRLFFELEQFLVINHKDCGFPISIMNPCWGGKQILYNTEQLTRPSVLDYFSNHIRFNDMIYEVWDYSAANVEILNRAGLTNARHVPFRMWNEYREELLSYQSGECHYDVGFCGWMASKRRVDIVEELRKRGLSVLVIQDLFGRDRDMMLSKCKIIMNLHFDENYRIFESYRCFAWIDINKTVVSENSIDNDDRCINVEYEEMADAITSILKSEKT